jgi:hypothetical protein
MFMHRAQLLESFHGESTGGTFEGIENLTAKGNETLTVKVNGGTLTFLTHSDEPDEVAIKKSRFVVGELRLENGSVFNFWLADEGRGGISETAIYRANQPQTG